ncbi:MAG: sugar transferase [Lentimicrobium sp.]|nr:sugar transferase [Lentimicrobium sp.]
MALLLLMPLLLLVSLLIKLTMPGPVLFRQTRIGFGGRPFTIYKFRSMKVNRSKVSITLSSDNRITPLGRFLRRSKIDELPQLWNILRGDMSVVGPRPDVPGYSDKLQGSDQLLWTVRPGLTGLDSISYPDEETLLDQQPDPQKYYDEVLWPDKVRLNLAYIKNRSFWMDIAIILFTVVRKKPLEKWVTGGGR